MARKPKITLHGPGTSALKPASSVAGAMRDQAKVFQANKLMMAAKSPEAKRGVSGATPGSAERVGLARSIKAQRQAQGLKPHQKMVMEDRAAAIERNAMRQRDAAKVARDKASQMNDPVQRARLIKDANSLNAEANRMEKQAVQLRSSASPADQIDAKIKQVMEDRAAAIERNAMRQRDAAKVARDKASQMNDPVQRARLIKDANSLNAEANRMEKQAVQLRSSASPADQIDQKMAAANASSRAFEADYAENLAAQSDARAKEARARGDSEGAARAEAAGKELRAKADGLRSTDAADPNARAERENAELDKFDYKGEHFNEKMFTPAEIEQSLTEAGVPAHQAGPIRRNMELMSGDKKWSPQQILDEYSGRVDPEKLKRAMVKAKAKASGGSGHWDDQPRVPAGNPDGGQWVEG